MLDKVRKHGVSILCVAILCVYLIAMGIVNFSGNPDFYVTDMYSDMNYAAEVWMQKTVFPEGWVFGNQLYAVATPVLAACFYGLTANHCIALAMATTVMGIGILLSFDWMLKPVLPSVSPRLIGTVGFLSLVLSSGDMYYMEDGWQLFFTMGSYYACYAIAVFLAFGCYLRWDSEGSVRFAGILAFTCLLSFGTGIQSLRQTAVMVCPLIAVEALFMICRAVRKEKIITRSTLITGLICTANLAGVLYSKWISVDQVEIFGNIELARISRLPGNFITSLLKIVSLLIPGTLGIALLLIIFALLAVLFCRMITEKNQKAILCLSLLILGVAAIAAVDTLTTMSVRNIYYFLLYPLLAVMGAFLYSCLGRGIRAVITITLVLIFAFNCTARIFPTIRNAVPNAAYEEVVSYLEENRITTVYSGWNCGEKIAMTSDWQITAGFWGAHDAPFVPVKFLCNPTVFDAEASHCAYIFIGEADAAVGVQAAEQRNADLTLEKYFAESDIYVFTSTEKLMQ